MRLGRKHHDLQLMAEVLMDEHQLYGWAFEWRPRSIRQLGVCDHRTKVLGFAPWLADTPIAEQRDTVLHEIAHALAGHAAKHGPKWRAQARRLGARPSHCTMSQDVKDAAPKGKWLGRCSEHGVVTRWHRQPQRVRACRKCSRTFDARYVLDIRHEDTGRRPNNRKYNNDLRSMR